MNPPSALHGAMSRERKPFTYTPGGLDLSEIKSERMAKRLMRNAMNQGVPEVPIQQIQSPPTPSTPVVVPNYNCLPVQVFPTINLPANPKSLLRTRSNADQPRNPPIQKIPPPAQFRNDTISDKIENSVPFYPHTNNSIQNRPASMYEYNTVSNNNNTSRRLSYGTDQYTSPLLPEISYEAEYFQVSPKTNCSINNNTPLTSCPESIEDTKLISDENLENITTNFVIQPISDTSPLPTPIVSKPVEDEAASVDKQREVKVVKKQVKKEQKVESSEQNGEANTEADLSVKLPTKKSAAKTETKVEVNKTVLPDGTVEEVKVTTTKTTIDGKTEIKTKTEKRIIPKEETEEEIEEEEEEQEEENDVEVEEVEEKNIEEPKKVVKTIVKESPVVANGQKETIVKKEESSTTTTKKVVVVQKEESEEEEEEEEEEIEEPEPVVVKKPPTPKPEIEEEEEEEEEEEVIEHTKEERKSESKVEDKKVKAEETVVVKTDNKEKVPQKQEEEEEEAEKEYEETTKKGEQIVRKEVVEEKTAVKESKEEPQEDEESEYTEEEYESENEEVIKDSNVKETIPTSKENEKIEPKEEKPAATEDKSEQPKSQPEQSSPQQPQAAQPASKPDQPISQPEQKVPLREPSIPLDKVEEVEIKPIGASSEVISKSHSENTEIIKSTNQQPTGPLSTQTEYNRIENIVTVNRTTKTLDHSYEQLTQQGVPTVKTYFPPNRERIDAIPQPARPYQPIYTPDSTAERRHSLLLDRLSVERQVPSSDIYQNTYQYSNQTYDQQRQWSQEPQSEVLNVSNVKPSKITNQQWYQQSNRENVIYNNVTPSAPYSQPWAQSQPQSQPPPQPQPQYQPLYTDSITQERTNNTYQQNNYPTYVPKPTNWASSNVDSLPSINTQSNQYSFLSKDSSESYQTSTQQYSSSYVPPPWEQDSSYVADTSNQNYYQPPPLSSSYTVNANPGWKPAPPNKFSKSAPTSYIPPAPNQSFVKRANIGAEPPKIPGRKTYYSEYERRYITVPESTYIPSETKFQPQPDPSPQYYYDNNEPREPVEHEWRKELREFTEKTSQFEHTTESSVKPPWEEDSKYGKTPSTYTPTPTWSQTLRPRSWRERSFESEYVGSQEYPRTNTLGRGRPLSSYGTGVDAPIPERPRGVSVDRYNPNNYNSPIPSEHPPVQTHTLVPTPPAKGYHNPNVPAYHTNTRASAEPREHSAIPQPRLWGEARGTPIQSRSFKYLQWITGTED